MFFWPGSVGFFREPQKGGVVHQNMEDLRLRLKAWQSGRLEKSGRNATESVMVVDIQSKEEGLWSQHFFEKFQYF